MRRIYLLLFAIILVLIAANIYYYLNIYRQQIDFQKNMLMKQTEICSWEIEHHISGFTNEINYILFTEDISRFFTDPSIKESSTAKIEDFFSKYIHLITSISYYDNQKNVFSIFKDRGNNLIKNIYVLREQTNLHDKENVNDKNGETLFTLPVFRDDEVVANIVVSIDTRRYIETVFESYFLSNTLSQWLLNSRGDIIFSNLTDEYETVTGFGEITSDQSSRRSGGSIIHLLKSEDREFKAISTYYPIRVMNQDMLVIFSLDTSMVISYILTSIITISSATFIVLVLIIGFFLYFIKKERKTREKSEESESSIKEIFESLPLGIIIKDPAGKVRLINSTALKILNIPSQDMILGNDLSNMFFLFRDYPGYTARGSKESTSEYVYYDDEEEEVILYKKEIPLKFHGENVTVEAFIDISPVEKARKKEFLWSEAKNEFLKRVSHDIRNPLNGILNLSDSLEMNMKPGKEDKEDIELIRQCCEDILLVVNDIMDFSGFDANKILVEEIPFSLSEEIDVVVRPLLNKAKEQNIEINTEIDRNVPRKIIGDPFHIRQVLSKLINNSLKYTSEGEITLTVKPKKQLAGNILLEFIVQDTGSGMPPDIVNKFNDKNSANELLTSGAYGLNKTRQLVELMKGDIFIESPVSEKPLNVGPGSRISFRILVYSNEISDKKLNFDKIKSINQIRALVLSDPGEEKSDIQKILGKLKVACETTYFNDTIIDLLKSNIKDSNRRYSIIFIIDSENSNGFSIARNLHSSGLDKYFLIALISSVNKPGNFIKSRHFGADHYLIEPYNANEIPVILENHFSHVSIPSIKSQPDTSITSKPKILVAEDNPSNQVVAQSLFKRLGYEIDMVSNGRDALNRVRETDYDIVFMDIRMPEKNGLDATYEIRKLGYKMPIVAMTANASESDKTEAIQVGMNEFIVKPVSLDIIKNIMVKRFSMQIE